MLTISHGLLQSAPNLVQVSEVSHYNIQLPFTYIIFLYDYNYLSFIIVHENMQYEM